MTDLNLISSNDGPDITMAADNDRFESLLADEVVIEWLRSLEEEARTATVN